MRDADIPARAASTTYTVILSGKAERLMRALAESRPVISPGAPSSPAHQLSDIASEAFARGLVELAEDIGLALECAELVGRRGEDARRADESATMARKAALLRAHDARAAMSRLAEAFPTLRGAPGVRPWDPVALHAWLGSSTADTSRSHDAAAFVLGVGDGNATWSLAFDAHRALRSWDGVHRAAFLAWASAPWWFAEASVARPP